MWFFTAIAPLVRAIRVATPLCCMTLVLPSKVAMRFSTVTVKWSLAIFDLTSLARIEARIWPSVGFGGGTGFFATVAGGPVDDAWPGPTKAASASAQIMNLTLVEGYTFG